VHALVIAATLAVLFGPAYLSRWRHRDRLVPA
jgi:hypothetical protein